MCFYLKIISSKRWRLVVIFSLRMTAFHQWSSTGSQEIHHLLTSSLFKEQKIWKPYSNKKKKNNPQVNNPNGFHMQCVSLHSSPIFTATHSSKLITLGNLLKVFHTEMQPVSDQCWQMKYKNHEWSLPSWANLLITQKEFSIKIFSVRRKENGHSPQNYICSRAKDCKTSLRLWNPVLLTTGNDTITCVIGVKYRCPSESKWRFHFY